LCQDGIIARGQVEICPEAHAFKREQNSPKQ